MNRGKYGRRGEQKVDVQIGKARKQHEWKEIRERRGVEATIKG